MITVGFNFCKRLPTVKRVTVLSYISLNSKESGNKISNDKNVIFSIQPWIKEQL